MYTEIIINYYTGLSSFNQIVFFINGFIDSVEPFELKHHAEYLNLPITRFEAITNF